MESSNANRRRLRAPGGRRQRGQALAEMAIVAAVVVPLFVLVPTLAKYFHIKQVTQQAARSAAWEATVVRDYEWNRLNRAEQRRLQLDRHFGLAVDPIRTQPSTAADGDDVRSELMNSFSNRALLKRSDVTLQPYRNESGGAVMRVIDSFGRMLELMPGEFPPNSNGLVTSELVVRPQNLKTSDGRAATFLAPFDTINLEMRANHTVLADAWNAAGGGTEGHASSSRARSVERQVESLVPLSSFEGVGEVLDDLGFLELLPVVGVVGRFRPGYIQPNIVPKDKLQPYRAP